MRVLSTMGLAGVLGAFGPAFEAAHGVTLEPEFLPTVELLLRIRAGERAAVAILTADGIDELVGQGVLAGRTDLARSFVGVAVRAGTPHPDISTPEAFVAALLAAGRIAMSKAGASGLFMAGLIERLGLSAPMAGRAIVLPKGFTAELVARGEADLAIQQVSELLVVPGVEIVGRLPAALGGETMFSAATFVGHAAGGTAAALVAALRSPDRAALYARCGLEAAGRDGRERAYSPD